MASPKPVGIDLGTTNSAVACVDATGRTAMVCNADGQMLTPSVVLFEDHQVVVGKEAQRAGLVEPLRVAEWVKRDMGQQLYSRPIQGGYLPPEVIQACILRRLKNDITEALGPDAAVVITVPAYFDEPRRKATADAGEMAGLTVLDIVNEPTAAALAFGESIGYLSGTGDVAREMTVLVYDLGGGTFDATLLRLAPGEVQCLATDGDVQLGGHDWDLRLVDHLAREYQRHHEVDPRQDPVSASRLMERAIEAKHALSARTRTTVRVQHAGKSVDVAITRADLARMSADLLERTLHTCREMLATMGMFWKHVDRLLLVGGATRMPMVAAALEALTGLAPDRSVNPDEAVARGAAIYARYLLAGGGGDSQTAAKQVGFSVTNVNAHSLGVEGIEPRTLRKTNVRLIPRNTPLPTSHTEKFTTKSENQRSIIVQVLQGESSDPEECTAIGRTILTDLPEGLPKNWPIEVSFTYETNGRLRVRAVVPKTGREVTLDLEREGGLSDERLGDWKPLVTSEAGLDAFETMIAEALEDALPAVPALWTTQTSPEQIDGVPTPVSPPIRSAPTPTPIASGPFTGPTQEPISEPYSEPEPFASSTRDARAMPEVTADDRQRGSRPLSRWITILLLWVTSAAAGLGAGYYVLYLWQPDRFPLPWDL